MSWARVDDGWYDHPKVVALSMAARGAWITMLTWSCKHATDGSIPLSVAKRLGIRSGQIAELVRQRLASAQDGAITLHDFLIYNPSSAERSAKREAAKTRMERVRGLKCSREQSANSARTSREVRSVPARPNTDHPLVGDSAREHAPPPPPPRPEAWAMTATWTPSDDELAGIGAPCGAPVEYVRDALGAFRSYWISRPTSRSDSEWTAALMSWVGRDWQRDRSRWLDGRRSGGGGGGRRSGPVQPDHPEDRAYLRERGWIS